MIGATSFIKYFCEINKAFITDSATLGWTAYSNSGIPHFNKLVCYFFYINLFNFLFVNIDSEEVINIIMTYLKLIRTYSVNKIKRKDVQCSQATR